MSDTKYIGGLKGSVTVAGVLAGASIANCTNITLPATKSNTVTVQGLDGPQVIGDIISDFGKLSFTMPNVGTASLVTLTSNASVDVSVTYGSLSSPITLVGTGVIESDEPGQMVRGQAIERKVTVAMDSLLA